MVLTMTVTMLLLPWSSTSAQTPASTQTPIQDFPSKLPTFECNIKPLTREGLKMALANRERFAKACLACVGDQCAMRIWPAGYENQESLCRNTFCLPKRVKRMAFAQGYNMRYRYTYKISPEGKAQFIEGEYLEGEPKGVTGKKTQAEHQELLHTFLTRAEYAPLRIDGRAKAIINLQADFEMGANYDE